MFAAFSEKGEEQLLDKVGPEMGGGGGWTSNEDVPTSLTLPPLMIPHQPSYYAFAPQAYTTVDKHEI